MMDELNEFLERMCGRCDDVRSQRSDCEDRLPQATSSDEYFDHLNDWY